MVEEKKPKRKTALIKHKKTDTPVKEFTEEKKKVVIVKKKVVKVKKSTERDAEDKIKEPISVKNKERIEEEKKTQPKKRKPGYLGKSPREPSPFEITEKKGVGQEEAGIEVQAGQKKYSRYKDKSTKQKRSKTPYNKKFINKSEKDKQSKKPFTKPGKPGESSGATKIKAKGGVTPAITENKPSAKKFYKTKKRAIYSKRKEEREEKVLQLKKKIIKPSSPVPKEISILEVITVSELAKKMNLKASELISKLINLGMMVNINQQIDAEMATILADEYGCNVKIVSLYDETIIEQEEDKEEDLLPRPPIVTVMGHVDHGKTKLLDTIRETDVMATEHGGITQHIGAYSVDLLEGKITFLDTPGHEAFTAMRARGAEVTDIVVLVVAANDGVMPQTIEAINHAKAGNVPIIVAINKMDLEDANPERIKKQLADFDLLPEDWGGHTLYNEISALKNQGIDKLLENILLQAEMLELRANYQCKAQGHVIESKVDLGRGIVATVLVERGTLKTGDSFIAGIYPGRVRSMFNDKGDKVDKVTPSTPIEILGFTGLPNAGDPFQVTENEKIARQISLKRHELKKMEEAKNVTKITLDNLYEQIKEGEIQELKVIVKGDVHGSVDALKTSLIKLSREEVKLTVIHASAGAINDNDVLLAAASNAIIVGFHVRPTPSALLLAEREKVEIRKYSIIYDAIEDVKLAMEGLLAPEIKEELLGIAEVREIFKIPKVGVIAGCYINNGKIKRGSSVHLIRDGVHINECKITSLKRFKDDVKEVESGFECGIGLENFNDLKVGDQIEAFEIREFAKKLYDRVKDAGDQKEKDQ
jgi:translation initiation factor IF-2